MFRWLSFRRPTTKFSIRMGKWFVNLCLLCLHLSLVLFLSDRQENFGKSVNQQCNLVPDSRDVRLVELKSGAFRDQWLKWWELLHFAQAEVQVPHYKETVCVPAHKNTTITSILLIWNWCEWQEVMLLESLWNHESTMIMIKDLLLGDSSGMFSSVLKGLLLFATFRFPSRFHSLFSQTRMRVAYVCLLCIRSESKNKMLQAILSCESILNKVTTS